MTSDLPEEHLEVARAADVSGEGFADDNVSEPHNIAMAPSRSSTRNRRRATGPRTERGKQRSSKNATKHGIFSGAVVLKSESSEEYGQLLASFQESLQPQGGLENLLVEKLAAISWRFRRLLRAEAPEIQKKTEFFEMERRDEDLRMAVTAMHLVPLAKDDGLLIHASNSHLFAFCLRQLTHLREKIEKTGFDPEYDRLILRLIYGDSERLHVQHSFFDSYEGWLLRLKTAEQDPKAWPSVPECKQILLDQMQKEILRLKRTLKERDQIDAEKSQFEITSHGVPNAPESERLLRYESTLERHFDRTLSQLERLQRMRLGQPVPPKLEVQHSLS